MDTPSNDPKSWSALTARARASAVPEIDVRHSVRRAITSAAATPAARENFLTALGQMTRSGWLFGSVAGFTALAGTATYLGLQALSELSFALSLPFSF